MTTSQSPHAVLKVQADKIAAGLKAAERGEIAIKNPEIAFAKPTFTVGIVMDDKVLNLEIPWKTIAETSEEALSAWIVEYMQGTADAAH